MMRLKQAPQAPGARSARLAYAAKYPAKGGPRGGSHRRLKQQC